MGIRRTTLSVLLVFAAVSAAAAQTRERPGETADPFSLSTGSYFSASAAPSGARPIERQFEHSQIANELKEAHDLIRQVYVSGPKLMSAEIIQPAIDGMLSALDPHSNFYDSKQWSELLDEHRSGYTGIGASIANFQKNGTVDTYVLSTFSLSPAERAQLRYGDRIVAVNGESMTGRSSNYVRDKIRGAVGTSVRISVERNATGKVEVITVRRGRVSQPSIPDSYMLRQGIGYIEMSDGFHYTTAREFDEALVLLKRQGMKALIIDLRGNGGGIVDQAVKVVEKFVPKGTVILTQRGRTGLDNREWRSNNIAPETMPVVVLVDRESASASEIVAGAFQDTDRAMIVGEKTFGKGLVQSVIELPGKNGLTLTTARYLTPSGRSIQREYAGVDSYDYFNHRTAIAAAAKPYFEARTVTNRKVIGGDGIRPDEEVLSQELTPEQASLLDALFFFARDLAAGRLTGFEGHRIVGNLSKKRLNRTDAAVTPEMVATFIELNATPEGPQTRERLTKQAEFIKRRLRLNLATAAFGQTTAAQVLIEDDPQVAKAVELLPRAAQLARASSTARSEHR
ncbi:MAG: S41 family peptidase [Acidobacteriota bacterium]|nr:MAG: S41 family peptidase [Acidobacteriota bacterium]